MALGGGTSVLAFILALASAPSPVPIEFDAPAGCSSADAFLAGIAARVDRAHIVRAGAEGVRLAVRLVKTAARVRGELRLTDGHGASETRTVDGTTCDEVIDVLALTTALALDPAAAASARSAPAPRATTSRSASTPPSPPSGGPAPSGAPPTGPAVPPASPPPRTTTAPPPPRPPPPPAAAAPTVAMTAPTAATRPRPFALEVGAQAAAAGVISPTVNVGGAVLVRVTRRNGAPIEPSLGLTVGYLPNDLVQSPSEAVIHWTAVTLAACPGWGWRRAVAVQACGFGTGGWLTATDPAVTNPRSVRRSSWAAGALARAALPLGAGLALELEVALGAPLVKRRFVTTTPERVVAETTSVFGLIGLGLTYRL